MEPSSPPGQEATYVNLEKLVHIVVHDQAVGKPDTMRLHGVTGHVGVVANVGVVKVGDPFLVIVDDGIQRLVTRDSGRIGESGRHGWQMLPGCPSCCVGGNGRLIVVRFRLWVVSCVL